MKDCENCKHYFSIENSTINGECRLNPPIEYKYPKVLWCTKVCNHFEEKDYQEEK